MDLFNSTEFTEHVNELMEQWHIPGLAIALIQDDTVASNGYGKAALDPERPVTADTLFDIASSSKSLTAAAVGILVADNEHYPQVQWNSDISNLMPHDFRLSGSSYTEEITVEDILSHRTGYPSHDSSYLGPRAAHPDDPQSVTQNLRNLEVAAPIRSKYMYCNMMFTVATYLVEHISGQSFEDVLHGQFLGPLGMGSTYLLPDSAIAAGLQERMAVPYKWDGEGTFTPLLFQQTPEAQGAGSIMTSANDHIKWVKALMNKEAPISPEIYNGLTKPRTLQNPDDDVDKLDPHTSTTLYAAGLEIYYYRGHKVVSHDGLIAGFGSIHFFLPELRFGGVIFGNSTSCERVVKIISRELIDEAIKVPPAERPQWDALEQKRLSEEEVEFGRENQKRRDELLTKGGGGIKEQKVLLEAYTGQYWNAGYHGMKVEIKDGKLFVDATDRSTGFTLIFEHLCNQKMYIAHLCDIYEGGDEELAAEFRFEDGHVVGMGIDLEKDLDGYIWFDKV